MSYREPTPVFVTREPTNTLTDEIGNEIQIRESLIDSENDVWRWIAYRIERNGDVETLHPIGVSGMNIINLRIDYALDQAAKEFRSLRMLWYARRKDNREQSATDTFNKNKNTLFKMFKSAYTLSNMTKYTEVVLGTIGANKYICDQIWHTALLCGEEADHYQLRLLKSGDMSVTTSDGQTFNVNIMCQELFLPCYRFLLTKIRQRKIAIPDDLNMTTIRKYLSTAE